MNSNDEEKLMLVILSVVQYSGDYNLSVKTVKQFFNHDNEFVRGRAVECISHIARLWSKIPDEFIKATHTSLGDKVDWIKGKADYIIDDLEDLIEGYNRPDNKNY